MLGKRKYASRTTCNNSDAEILELGEAYSSLQRRLLNCENSAKITKSAGAWTIDCETEWLATIDPICDKIFEIACRIVELPAVSDEAIAIKAQILFDQANGDADDVVYRLATSLASDIQSKTTTKASSDN
jgi:hypothetical protein